MANPFNEYIRAASGNTATITALVFPIILLLCTVACPTLGTFHLPKNTFSVETFDPIAGQSAYTIISANRIRLENRPSLVLNQTIMPMKFMYQTALNQSAAPLI